MLDIAVIWLWRRDDEADEEKKGKESDTQVSYIERFPTVRIQADRRNIPIPPCSGQGK